MKRALGRWPQGSASMDRQPEILAPAGGMEALIAAVRCGADAVYMGAKHFNARRNAQNFGEGEFERAIEYCHARGVRVYVTLNTLVLDPETKDAQDTLCDIAQCAADGVIVQDLGVAAMIRRACPSLPLHASTQMTIHNAAGARALEELGFTRAVLARELTEKEIESIAAQTSLELEVFVHGALCMSVSGQCYLSALLGGRSGNRGLCAQPCRLDFNSEGRGYALSLKDLSLISHMDKLKKLGVSALKIEGRMKRPEYVAAAVTACRDALEGHAPDMEALKAVFSRSGFTDGYFSGRRDISMFGSRTKEDVTAAAPVLGRLAALYKDETLRVPVDMTLTVREGEPASLTVTDGVLSVNAQGPQPEAARTQPLDEAYARRSLEKTGGTPFYLWNLSCDIQAGMMLSASVLNKLRRDTLERLEAMRGQRAPLPCDFSVLPGIAPEVHKAQEPELRQRFRKVSQLSEEALACAARVLLPVEEISAHPGVIEELGDRLTGELPLLAFPGAEERLHETLAALKDAGLTDVIAGNLGTLYMACDMGFTVRGDYSLNILNTRALDEARRLGAADVTLSFEMALKLAEKLAGETPRGIIAYGRLPLMTYRNCPAKGAKGCGSCPGQSALTDRLGKRFPVVCRGRAHSQLLNSVPLYLADKLKEPPNVDFLTLYFTIETARECADVVRQYVSHAPAEGEFTRGLYYRNLQ